MPKNGITSGKFTLSHSSMLEAVDKSASENVPSAFPPHTWPALTHLWLREGEGVEPDTGM